MADPSGGRGARTIMRPLRQPCPALESRTTFPEPCMSSVASRPPSSRPRRYVADFQPAERIEGAFAIANAQLGRTKQDKPFLKCLIGDKTGQVAGRMWSIEIAHFKRIPTDGFVYI